MADAPVLEIEGLHYRYPDGTLALAGLDLKVERGRRVALLGPNGAGKTTLLLHLNGLLLPQQGRVVVLGRELDRTTCRWAKAQVGLVFQDPDDQLFAPSVWDDVAFGPANMGLSPAEVRQRVTEALQAVGAADLAQRAPHRLSLGQKKRVAIAGVLAMAPQLLVLDEPTAFLDPAGQADLLAVLERLHARGHTLLLATHDVDLAAVWAEEVVIMVAGKVVAAGSPRLLTDAGLMQQCGLRLPLVSELFARLEARGQAWDHRPLSVGEAAEMLLARLGPAPPRGEGGVP
ncbi:MAG: ATP-binding cassette domain-containing protein [Clostridia bacterium]|nr:ATP-binding cassette domain-containing protein [Clostridia bacterium]